MLLKRFVVSDRAGRFPEILGGGRVAKKEKAICAIFLSLPVFHREQAKRCSVCSDIAVLKSRNFRDDQSDHRARRGRQLTPFAGRR